MPPGITGPLLSRDFLSSHLARVCPNAATIPVALVSEYRRWHRAVVAALGPVSALRSVVQQAALPLVAWLGLEVAPATLTIDGDGAWAVLVAPGSAPVTLSVAPWAAEPRRLRRQAARRALAAGTRWALLTNGRRLELLDTLRPWAQQHLSFDLPTCRDLPASLAILHALCGAASFRTAAGTARISLVVTASDRHAVRVCADLADGVRAAVEELTSALAGGAGKRPPLSVAYEHALTAVYRVLFLLFAESRGLVPAWHPVYRDAYTVASLCDRIAAGTTVRGTWAALQAIARLAHDGAVSGDLTVTAFNGRLFAPSAAPLLDHLRLEDGAVSRALASLTMTSSSGGGARRIVYADLGVEQLGGVYEGLLDYAPDRSGSGAARLIRQSSPARQRKATGTFYTPSAITDHLVRSTLEPLVAGRSPDDLLRLRVVDPAMGSGAFLVAACRFLAEAYEAALIAAGNVTAADLDSRDRATFRRIVASRCLFGVDVNPMAVQLARLSLWLATLSADRPLSFLDHHLVAGDSLIGASPMDVAHQAPGGRLRASGDGPLTALLDAEATLSTVLPIRRRLESADDDTVEAVRHKERDLRDLDRDPGLERWRLACDLWCAAWFAEPARQQSAVNRAVIDRVLGRGSPLPAPAHEAALGAGLEIARQVRPCHWSLVFPEVFLDASGRPASNGGFDAVLGNPPWEMLRRDRGETDARRHVQQALVRFARHAGIYRASPHGHANMYQLFVERALFLARRGGRVGLVVPMGLLTDESSAVLRRRLFDDCRVDGVLGFENRRAIFPIHRSVRFAVFTATTAARTDAVGCRLGETDPDVLGRLDTGKRFPVTLTRNLLERLSGPGLAVPDLRSEHDLALTERLYSQHPALGDPAGWHARFSRELNASDDRDLFRPAGRAAAGDLPVVDGRHLSPFRVDLSRSTTRANAHAVRKRLGTRDLTNRPRLAYRDVAGASNRQTLIAAVLPGGVVSVHTVFCLRTGLSPDDQDLLCALLNSFVANYLVRQRVSTHVTTAILERVPVPRPAPGSVVGRDLAGLAAALRTGRPDPILMAEVQATAARAWGVRAAELTHVLTTFPLIGDAEKALVMRMFSRQTPP